MERKKSGAPQRASRAAAGRPQRRVRIEFRISRLAICAARRRDLRGSTSAAAPELASALQLPQQTQPHSFGSAARLLPAAAARQPPPPWRAWDGRLPLMGRDHLPPFTRGPRERTLAGAPAQKCWFKLLCCASVHGRGGSWKEKTAPPSTERKKATERVEGTHERREREATAQAGCGYPLPLPPLPPPSPPPPPPPSAARSFHAVTPRPAAMATYSASIASEGSSEARSEPTAPSSMQVR